MNEILDKSDLIATEACENIENINSTSLGCYPFAFCKIKNTDNEHVSQRSGCSVWKNGTLAG